MTNKNTQITITGDLEGLLFSETDAQLLIDVLSELDRDLRDKIIGKSLNIAFMSSESMHELNTNFLNNDKPTNVLSFPATKEDNAEGILGDVAICPKIIKEESTLQNKLERDHLFHLIVHSLLHLAGFDHKENVEADLMESLEIRALKKIGIANPY